jgi:hypothetical protein
MTVGLGNKIEAAEYTAIQGIIEPILGTGSGQSGYGQSVQSSSVGVVQYSKISSAQWTNLRNDIVACRQHQNGITIIDKGPYDVGYIAGQSLKIPTKDIQIKEQDRGAYLSMANDCVTNKLAFDAAQQSTVDLLNPTGSTSNGIRNTSWNGTISHTVTITFPGATDIDRNKNARYFFNAGGRIQFTASRWNAADGTGTGTASTKNYSWNRLLFNMGTISFGATSTSRSNTNGTLGATTGFYPMGVSGTTLGFEFLQYSNALSSELYAPNQYSIYATVNSNGSITFRVVFADLSTSSSEQTFKSVTNPFDIDEDVTGYTSSFIKAVYSTSNPNVVVSPPAVTSQSAL